MTTNPNLLADYVASSQFNRIYPFGSLPSNFFFRRVSPNPWYMTNEARNTKIALSKKPTVYNANSTADQSAAAHYNDVSDEGNTRIFENSTKSLIGPYIDTCHDKRGMQFNYQIHSGVRVEDNQQTEGHIYVSYDLLNQPLPSAFTKNLVKYIKLGTMESTVCPPCDGQHQPAIEGVIVLCGKDAAGVDKCTEYNLAEAVKGHECHDAPVAYKVEGNKIVFKLKKEHRVEAVNSEFSASIIEEQNRNILSIEEPVIAI